MTLQILVERKNLFFFFAHCFLLRGTELNSHLFQTALGLEWIVGVFFSFWTQVDFSFSFFAVWVFKNLLWEKKRKGFMQNKQGHCCWFQSGAAGDDGNLWVFAEAPLQAISSSLRLIFQLPPFPLQLQSVSFGINSAWVACLIPHPPSHNRHSFWSDSLPASVPRGYISVGSVFQLWLQESECLWDLTFRFQERAHVCHRSTKCFWVDNLSRQTEESISA